MLLSHALTLYASQFVHKKKSLRIYDGEPGVVASVSPLSNGRLCAGAYEKIPRTFAQSVGLFSLIILTSDVGVCALSFVPRTPPKRHDFNPDGVCGVPLFAPPSISARVQSRFEFVELGVGMCSNYHMRHWDYRLVPDWYQLVPSTVY